MKWNHSSFFFELELGSSELYSSEFKNVGMFLLSQLELSSTISMLSEVTSDTMVTVSDDEEYIGDEHKTITGV